MAEVYRRPGIRTADPVGSAAAGARGTIRIARRARGASGSARPGRPCPRSSACPCRTGGSWSRRRRAASGGWSRPGTSGRMCRSSPRPGRTWDGGPASCLHLRGLGDHADALLVLRLVLETDAAIEHGEDRVVPAQAGALTGDEGHASLADDDRAGGDELAVAGLHAEPLADAVAAVGRAGTGFLVRHRGYSSFFVGFVARGALGLAAGGGAWVRLAAVLGGFGAALAPAPALVAGLAGFSSAAAAASAAFASFASFAASALSAAACLAASAAAAASRRWRSVTASAASFRALLPSSSMSETCRMVRSARWPCLTRLRALGRYLKTTILSPRSWRTTSALTRPPFTSGWPVAARSSSATSRTCSNSIVWPGSTSSRSTASSVPSWTRYCLPPLSMTAYMVPLRLSRARGGRREAGRRVRGREEAWYCRGRQASNRVASAFGEPARSRRSRRASRGHAIFLICAPPER